MACTHEGNSAASRFSESTWSSLPTAAFSFACSGLSLDSQSGVTDGRFVSPSSPGGLFVLSKINAGEALEWVASWFRFRTTIRAAVRRFLRCGLFGSSLEIILFLLGSSAILASACSRDIQSGVSAGRLPVSGDSLPNKAAGASESGLDLSSRPDSQSGTFSPGVAAGVVGTGP